MSPGPGTVQALENARSFAGQGTCYVPGMIPPKTILVSTDFSELSKYAVTYAADLAATLGATLVLVHVYQMPPMLMPGPYGISAELARVRARHGHVVLFDAHSIRSELPWLFPGRLPDLNLGTAGGSSCAPSLERRVVAVLSAQTDYSLAVNGRFKGGHITRAYGRPGDGVHAVQLEMAWRLYLDEAEPARWDEARAAAITPLLRQMVQVMLAWRPA